MSLLVVGSVAYDSIETPSAKRDDVLGGSATFFSYAASFFTDVRLVAVIGEDFLEADLDRLRQRRVDLTGLVREPGESFRWGGRYHDNMNERTTLFTYLNVFQSFKPVLPPSYRATPLVFLANIDPALQLDVLDQIESPELVACDTMNFWIDGKRDELLELLARIDVLVVNEEEALDLSGAHYVAGAGRAIQELGPRTVIIKRGEYGAVLFSDQDIFFVHGYPVEDLTDPTGAGDTFAGGFMGYLARTRDFSARNMRVATVVGSLMASFVVEGFSLEGLYNVDMQKIHERYRDFVAHTQFDPLKL
ncbi:MAG: sugar kinase [Myxococcales bacterium]|nr:sugar kinase [Myxococcales bacterium]